MKVILQKDIAKVGKRFDIKEVSSGYALNLLIPQGSAVPATPENIKRASVAKAAADVDRKVREDLLVKNIKDLDGITLTVSGKASDKGHLFAGFHRAELAAELLKQTQLQVDPAFIQLEHPLKEIGEHMIEVKGGGKSAKFKVVVEAVK